MLESVGDDVPTEDISKAVFYLVKEVGLSHEEIFGGTEYVNFVEEVERDGVLGSYIDYVFGPKKLETTEVVDTKGMSLKAFAAYLELFEEHEEEKEKQRKTKNAKNKMKNQTFG